MNKNITAEGTTMDTTMHNHKEHTTANAPFYSSFFESLHKEQWQEVRLGEVAEIKTDIWKVGGEQQKQYIGLEHIAADSLRLCGIGNSNEISSNKYIFKENDILFGKLRPYFRKIIKAKFKGICSTDIWVIRAKQNIDQTFLFYFFANKTLINLSYSSSKGTRMPRADWNFLSQTTWLLPPLETQRKIAEILSSFDDKIDLLTRQNKTLESLALTLFRHSFIDNPNRNEWEEKPLSEIADFLNGLACQKIPPKNEIDRLPVLKIKELREGITESSDWATSEVDSKYIVQNGDIIFSWSASLMVKIWNGQKCILNQHLFKITSAIYPKWFYYFWCLCHLQEFISIASAQATTMGHIKRQDLDNAICLIPDNHTLRELDKVIAPLLLKINNNSQQIQNLQSMRDMLLAKILNEKMEV